MDRIVCIKGGTNAALHALALAALQDGAISASEAAARLQVSPSYLSKILQDLVSTGIVESLRGFGGGFSLKKPAGEISCLDVVEAVEGASLERYCLFETPVCGSKDCAIHALCKRLHDELQQVLASTSIADLSLSFSDAHNKPVDVSSELVEVPSEPMESV